MEHQRKSIFPTLKVIYPTLRVNHNAQSAAARLDMRSNSPRDQWNARDKVYSLHGINGTPEIKYIPYIQGHLFHTQEQLQSLVSRRSTGGAVKLT